MLLLAISYFGFYLHKFLVRDEANNNEFTNEHNQKDEKEMDSAVENDKDTKVCMNHQSYASNEHSQEGERDIASVIETNGEIEVIEDTKNCLPNEGLTLATTNVYVNSDVLRQINSFNVYNNAKSVGIFDYNYKIGNLTLETADTQLDENYYNVNFFTSKIRVERESANKYYKEEDVESESANISSEEDDDSESAYIFKEEDVKLKSAYRIFTEEDIQPGNVYNIYNKKDVVSESANNIYNKKDVVSESANNIYNKKDVVSESANNIYNKKDVVSESANNIYNKKDVVSESANNIYNKKDVVSESANNIYNKKDVVSESANNIYNKKDVVSESANNNYNREDVELDGANSVICENIDFYKRSEDDDESGQIVGSIFLTDYSLNSVIVIDETNHHKKNYYCCVCDYLVEDEENINLHIKSSNHVKALKLSPPLENNECIRYIYDQYHCALCDNLFKGPLLNHFIGTSHILCATFAKNKALNLRQRATLNEKTNKKKSKTKKQKTKSDRQNGNVPRSIRDSDSDADCDKLVKSVKREVASQENKNLSSSVLAESAYENNCHVQKPTFRDYYNIPVSSYGENFNLLQSASSENYNLSKHKNAYEVNFNLLKSAYQKNCNIPKYEKAYEDKAYEENSANPEIFNFLKNKEAYQENCNLPSQATLEFYNFLKYMEAYKRKCNLPNSANSKIYNFPKCKEAHEENLNFPDPATLEFYNFFKHMQAYEKKFNSLNSMSPENYSFPKCKQSSYEGNSNLSNSATSENFNLAKHTKAYEENRNYVPKSSYKEKYNVDFNKSAEINNRQENESKVNMKFKRIESKNEMTGDELENLVDILYEAKVLNRNSEFVVEFLGSALHVDVKSYNFIKKVSEFEMFCMICYTHVENQYLDSHINKVLHVIKVKNAYYDPVYGCHLLRPMPCKRYHCTLCNEEFARKMLTTHILSDNHKSQLARSLITDWNCKKPYNEENRSMMTEKKLQVLPVLESEKILEVTELNFVDWMQEKTEIVSSNDLKFDAFTDEVLSEDLNQEIPSVLPVLESEKILEVTELNFVDWMQEKTEIVSSNDLKFDAFTDEVLSEDLNQEIPSALPVLESEKILEDNELELINSIPENTETVWYPQMMWG